MMEILLTHKDDSRFLELIKLLDDDLYDKYGDIQKTYEKYIGLENLVHVAMAFCGERAVGCGGYKKYDNVSAEIKRIYVLPEYRGCGYAEKIMDKLHEKAKEGGYKKCLLETGPKQEAAIRLYQRLGYEKIDNYEPYIGMTASICFEKQL